MPLNDGGVFADFDFSAPLGCLRLGIIHSNGWTTTYKHCVDTSLVEVGEEVVQGQPIALCGSEGQSTGSHCHFELRIDGVAIDAETVLQPWPEDKLKLSDEMVESYWQSKGVFLCLAGGL